MKLLCETGQASDGPCVHMIAGDVVQRTHTSNLSLLDLACASKAASSSFTLSAIGSSLAMRADSSVDPTL